MKGKLLISIAMSSQNNSVTRELEFLYNDQSEYNQEIRMSASDAYRECVIEAAKQAILHQQQTTVELQDWSESQTGCDVIRKITIKSEV
ncbi:MAG TPA: hypothetical protein VF581_07875 [Flavobacterium sp.]|jgi:hypothetical protein